MTDFEKPAGTFFDIAVTNAQKPERLFATSHLLGGAPRGELAPARPSVLSGLSTLNGLFDALPHHREPADGANGSALASGGPECQRADGSTIWTLCRANALRVTSYRPSTEEEFNDGNA